MRVRWCGPFTASAASARIGGAWSQADRPTAALQRLGTGGAAAERSQRSCQWPWRVVLEPKQSPENVQRGSGGSFLTFCCVCLWWRTQRWVRSCSSTLKEGARPLLRRITLSSWVRLSGPYRTSPVSYLKHAVLSDVKVQYWKRHLWKDQSYGQFCFILME